MTRTQAMGLAAELSHASFKEDDSSKRYCLYVLQESLLTEFDDLDYEKHRREVLAATEA